MNRTEIKREGAVATLTLNRADVHNAFDDALIAELTDALRAIDADDAVRVLVLTGAGASFSAGADLNWMRSMASASEADNLADALRLAELMRTLDGLSKPTIARINGSAFGGGVGLIACCDMAVAVDGARFGLTETRLGLVPAVISPYVIAAIGTRNARRYFLTAELFDAATAAQIGLVHETCADDQLDARVAQLIKPLLAAGPNAVHAAKRLIARVGASTALPANDVDHANASLIASLRVSAEGQEGLAAFLSKRKPAWTETAQ